MRQLTNHRKWTMLVLMFAAALGCASAALSGTLAVASYRAPLAAEAPAGRSAQSLPTIGVLNVPVL